MEGDDTVTLQWQHDDIIVDTKGGNHSARMGVALSGDCTTPMNDQNMSFLFTSGISPPHADPLLCAAPLLSPRRLWRPSCGL